MNDNEIKSRLDIFKKQKAAKSKSHLQLKYYF